MTLLSNKKYLECIKYVNKMLLAETVSRLHIKKTKVESILKDILTMKGTLNEVITKLESSITHRKDIINFEEMEWKTYYKTIKNTSNDNHRFKLTQGSMLYNEKQYRFGANYAMWKILVAQMGLKINLDKICVSYSAMAELSDIVKKIGPSISANKQHWTMISGVNSLYGSIPIFMTDQQILEKVKKWVNNDYKPTYLGSETRYYEEFEEATDKALNWGRATITSDETIDQYISILPNIATTGSGYDPDNPTSNFKMHQKDKTIKCKKTKFTVTSGLTKDQKIKKMLSTGPSKCRVSVKKEKYPKIRLIISSDYKTFLKMNYIRRWLKRWMANNNISTLWMNDKQRLDLNIELASVAPDVAIPIDQSAFDHHYPVKLFLIQMNSLKKIISINENNVEVRENLISTIDAMITSVMITKIVVPGKDGKNTTLDWRSGLLSGWGLTADLNTLKNIAEKIIGEKIANEYTEEIPTIIKSYNAQGDDQFVRTETFYDALMYYCALSSTGAEINLQKNFFSSEHDEYLRITGTNKTVAGYLPRAIDSLMWEPTLVKQTNQQKINEQYSIWSRIASRMYAPFTKVMRWFKNDAIRNKIPIDEIEIFLNNPRTIGGAGITIIRSEEEYTLIENVQEELIGNIEIDGAGIKQFEDLYLTNQRSGFKSWLLSNIEILNRSDFSFTKPEIFFKKTNIVTREFIIAEGVEMKKPQYKDGWNDSTIITINDRVMQEAFPTINTWISGYRASKKFIYEWITGKLKITRPTIPNISDNVINLYCKGYDNSLIYAMLKKRNKNINMPWLALSLYYEKEMLRIISKKTEGYYFGN